MLSDLFNGALYALAGFGAYFFAVVLVCAAAIFVAVELQEHRDRRSERQVAELEALWRRS